MNKDKSLIIYGGIFFGVFLLISMVLAFTVYSGKARNSQVNNEQANITPAQNQVDNNNMPTSQMPEITPTPNSDLNNMNTPTPLNSVVPTDISNQNSSGATPSPALFSSPEVDSSPIGGDAYLVIGNDKTNVLQKQIQVCFASYIAERDSLPTLNNIDDFKNFLNTGCGLDKSSLEDIENVSVIDPSVNYKINLTFKDGKTYENTPQGFTAIN